MKLLRSAHPGPRLAVIAILGVLLARPTVAQSTTPTFVQAATFSTGSRVSTVTVTLTQSVAQGDLLVGWVSQYGAAEQVQVSDNVNGAWARGPGSLRFMDDTGDIALYYRENSQAAPGGLTITVTVSSSAPAYLQGSVADYSGIALAGALDQVASARGIGTTVDTGATAAVDAGELVFAALITGDDPRSVTPGSSAGVPYTPRAQNSNGSAFAEDITSSAAGAQQGTATLGAAANWLAVCAVFHAAPATAPQPPSTPAGLEASSVASTRVALSWSPSSGSVAGYGVYRNGVAIGTTRPDTTIFLDPNVTPATAYTYSVDAFDTANDHSAQSAPLAITTPALSPEFVQGAAASPSAPSTSYALTLTEAVAAGDLLVGWFGQAGASGEVQVSDNVNGPWTRSVSSTWGGAGDIALFYRQPSTAAPSGLVITVSASAPAYLQEAVADYRHVGALDQAVVSQGTGTYATAGPTASVPAGELVVAAVLTGGQPGSAAAGSSQRVPYLIDAQNGSASSDLEDILSSAAGPQEGSLTLGSASNWVMVLATFQSTTGSTTTTSTTTPPTTTSTSTTTTTIRGTTTSTTTTRPPTTTTPTSTTTTTTRSTTTSTATTRPPTTTTPTSTTTTSTVPRTTTTARPTTTTQTTTTRPATSTTSRSTTTTTPVQTTTTTTTPLLACGGLYPLCLGSCPPGLTCTGRGLLGTCSWR